MLQRDNKLLFEQYSRVRLNEGMKQIKEYLMSAQIDQDSELYDLLTSTHQDGKPIFADPHVVQIVKWNKEQPINVELLKTLYDQYKRFRLNQFENYNNIQEFEIAIDNAHKKLDKKQNEKEAANADEINPANIISDKDDQDVLIVRCSTKEDSIQARAVFEKIIGKELTFCIGRADVGNMWDNYRVHGSSTFYYILFNEEKHPYPGNVCVLDAKNSEAGHPYEWTFADNITNSAPVRPGDDILAFIRNDPDLKGTLTWNHIVSVYPELEKYKHLFKSAPLSQEEITLKRMTQFIRGGISLQQFNQLTIQEQEYLVANLSVYTVIGELFNSWTRAFKDMFVESCNNNTFKINKIFREGLHRQFTVGMLKRYMNLAIRRAADDINVNVELLEYIRNHASIDQIRVLDNNLKLAWINFDYTGAFLDMVYIAASDEPIISNRRMSRDDEDYHAGWTTCNYDVKKIMNNSEAYKKVVDILNGKPEEPHYNLSPGLMAIDIPEVFNCLKANDKTNYIHGRLKLLQAGYSKDNLMFFAEVDKILSQQYPVYKQALNKYIKQMQQAGEQPVVGFKIY